MFWMEEFGSFNSFLHDKVEFECVCVCVCVCVSVCVFDFESFDIVILFVFSGVFSPQDLTTDTDMETRSRRSVVSQRKSLSSVDRKETNTNTNNIGNLL